MHATTGHWQRGLLLASITAVCWGVLPIALKHLLEGMDALTVTWYRLASAAVTVGLFLAWRGALPRRPRVADGTLWLCILATGALAGNYVLYLLSLELTTPTVAQVVAQVSPLCLLFGGLLVFGERLARSQWLGVAVLLVGLTVFFHDRLRELLTLDSRLGLGALLMLGASIVWASYALMQKQLLVHYGSAQVLFMLYAGSIPLLLPAAHPSQLADLDAGELSLLVFCCVNTLVGYGCFAEALHHWQVSRVGAIVALAPLITIGAVHLLAEFWPGTFAAEPLSAISLFGALLVVTGSVTCALGAADDDPAASMPEVSAEVSRQPAVR